MSDKAKPNLAAFRPARRAESQPGSAPASKGRQIHFSAAEADAIWGVAIEDAGQRSNDDFKKAFEGALRTRAMRKLFLFGSDGLELKLATGQNWTPERWVAVETPDGGIVLKPKE
jgi:hypothetical protein